MHTLEKMAYSPVKTMPIYTGRGVGIVGVDPLILAEFYDRTNGEGCEFAEAFDEICSDPGVQEAFSEGGDMILMYWIGSGAELHSFFGIEDRILADVCMHVRQGRTELERCLVGKIESKLPKWVKVS